MMKADILKTIQEFDMLRQGDRVAVGISGGADSVALLSLLCSLRQELNLHIVGCHVNHNLRGQESLRDEQFVRHLCEQLDVECHVYSADISALARKGGGTVEETAREIRYRFFAQTAGQRGKIATAHTAADNTETVLLNLTRGSGLRGLCGIPPVRGNIIRPLIGCTRRQTEEWCRQNGLLWVEDSTNAGDAYTRNRLRHHVVPVLREQNPSVDRTVFEMAGRLRRDADFLDGLARQARQRLTTPDGRLERLKLLEQPRPLLDRILLGLIAEYTQPSARLAGLCLELTQQGSGAQQLAAGVWFTVQRDSVGIQRQIQPLPETGEAEIPPMIPGQKLVLELGGRSVLAHLLPANLLYSENIYKFPLKNLLCYDKIQRILVLRTRRSGDRMTLPFRRVSKTIKKLFCEEKVPPQQRQTRLVLAERQGKVLWVEEIGPAADVLPTSESKLILVLSNLSGEDKPL